MRTPRAQVAALRRLLRSGPRTNRARPTELNDPPAPAPPSDDSLKKGSRLAELLQTHEGLDEAEPLMRQEVVEREQMYGFGSEHTLVSVTCLAMCLQAKGVADESLRLYTRVVEGYESLEKFGPMHTDTLNAVNNLAVFLKSLGRFDKALPLYERVLAGDEAAHGPDHPHTLDSVFNLARLYAASAVSRMQRLRYACTCRLSCHLACVLERHLSRANSRIMPPRRLRCPPLLRGSLLSCSHPPLTLTPSPPAPYHSTCCASYRYDATDKPDKATPLYRRELKGCSAHYGKEHTETRTSAFNLAEYLEKVGDHRLAIASHSAFALPSACSTLAQP